MEYLRKTTLTVVCTVLANKSEPKQPGTIRKMQSTDAERPKLTPKIAVHFEVQAWSVNISLLKFPASAL
eukprot:4867985-Amphidinium_carterae.1